MKWPDFRRKPCPTHDQPYPMLIAQLEEDTGIQPGAVAELFVAGPSFVDKFANPDLIDCGRRDCRKRREEQRNGPL